MTIHIARMHAESIPPAAASGASVCVLCDRTFASATAYYYHAATCFEVTEEPVCPGAGAGTGTGAKAVVAETISEAE